MKEINRELQAKITPEHVIAVLNEALEADRDAITALVLKKVPCNDALADHPTIQVRKYPGDETASVGFLGMLNGLFGVSEDGWGCIAASFDVVCPNGHDIPEELEVQESCPECNSKLALGKILSFKQIRFAPEIEVAQEAITGEE